MFRGFDHYVSWEYLLSTFNLQHGTFKMCFRSKQLFQWRIRSQRARVTVNGKHLLGISLRNSLFRTEMQEAFLSSQA